jgi:aconitase A
VILHYVAKEALQAGLKFGGAMLHCGMWIAGGNEVYAKLYGNGDTANPKWAEIKGTTADTYAWDEKSTYVQSPPFFDPKIGVCEDIIGARPLGIFGDSVTTRSCSIRAY